MFLYVTSGDGDVILHLIDISYLHTRDQESNICEVTYQVVEGWYAIGWVLMDFCMKPHLKGESRHLLPYSPYCNNALDFS